MVKLQVLNGSLAGKSFELKAEKTAVGRVEDNTIQIAEPSVSSHHCEIFLIHNDVIVKDLGSTNGTFIGGEKITEAVLKPGQMLRLGQVDLRYDDGTPLPPAVPAATSPAPSPAPAAPKPRLDQTVAVQRGVSLDQLAEPKSGGFDTSTKGFSKKTNAVNRYFVIGGILVGLAIIIGLIIALMNIK